MCPSSGVCDYVVELPYCPFHSWFDVFWINQIKKEAANVVVQLHNRKLLKMGTLMPETCWVSNKWNKSNKWHLVGYLFVSYHDDARFNKHQIKRLCIFLLSPWRLHFTTNPASVIWWNSTRSVMKLDQFHSCFFQHYLKSPRTNERFLNVSYHFFFFCILQQLPCTLLCHLCTTIWTAVLRDWAIQLLFGFMLIHRCFYCTQSSLCSKLN